MRVLVGNKTPKVGHKLPNGQVEFEKLPPGDYVTEVRATDMLQITSALTLHFWEGDTPTWVACEDKGLELLLAEYYGIEENSVPDEWRLNEN